MIEWKKIKKIDAHVHLLPPDRLALWSGCTDEPWAHASIDTYLKIMDEYNIEKALLLPINDGRTYYEHADDTNRWFGDIQKQSTQNCVW